MEVGNSVRGTVLVLVKRFLLLVLLCIFIFRFTYIQIREDLHSLSKPNSVEHHEVITNASNDRSKTAREYSESLLPKTRELESNNKSEGIGLFHPIDYPLRVDSPVPSTPIGTKSKVAGVNNLITESKGFQGLQALLGSLGNKTSRDPLDTMNTTTGVPEAAITKNFVSPSLSHIMNPLMKSTEILLHPLKCLSKLISGNESPENSILTQQDKLLKEKPSLVQLPYEGESNRCRSPCPNRTLIVVYRYPEEILRSEKAVVGESEESATIPLTKMSSLFSPLRPLQELGFFVLRLLRNASRWNLLRFRDILTDERVTNTPISMENTLSGFGVSLDVLNLSEEDMLFKLQNAQRAKGNNTLRDVESLQRGFVVLRLLSLMEGLGNSSAEKNSEVTRNLLEKNNDDSGTSRRERINANTMAPDVTEKSSFVTKVTRQSAPPIVSSGLKGVPEEVPRIVHGEQMVREQTQLPRKSAAPHTAPLTNFAIDPPSQEIRFTTRTQELASSSSLKNQDHLLPSYDPPFFTTYFSSLHMESIEAPTEDHAILFRTFLALDHNVAAVYEDAVLGFGENFNFFEANDTSVEPLDEDEASPTKTDQLRSLQPSEQKKNVSGSILLPSDRYFKKQWTLTNSSTNPAGCDFIGTFPALDKANNSTITVALIDSGVDSTHEDLIGRLWKNEDEICDNGIDDDKNGYIDDCYGWVSRDLQPYLGRIAYSRDIPHCVQDFIQNDNIPQDEVGHGTASAGIIAAVPNNELGITPVCWNCRIMNLRVLDARNAGPVSGFVKNIPNDSMSGRLVVLLQAVDYALKKNIRISNNSYGGYGSAFNLLNEAVRRAQRNGMVFVAAAGNDSDDNEKRSRQIVPASWRLDNIISVAAVDELGKLSWFSNWGSKTVDIGAPGERIVAPTPGGAYRFLSGSSFAAAHVSGLVALTWDRLPTLTYKQVVESVLDGSRLQLGLQGKIITGGTIDARRTLLAAAKKRSDKNFRSETSSLECSDGYSASPTHQCIDTNECLTSVCPSMAHCINFDGTYECRCPFGAAWNGLDGKESACHIVETPKSGPCVNNGSCGLNSLCQIQITGSEETRVVCRCLDGYVKHRSALFCIREGLESIDPLYYLSKIRTRRRQRK